MDAIRSWWSETGLWIAVAIAVGLVLSFVLRVSVGRFRRRLEGAGSATQAIDLQRGATLAQALSTAMVVLLWTIIGLLVLDRLGVNLAPLIASAGIAGVALGFGAQSIVKDSLTGFFILLENQFGVGDVLEIQTTANPVSGKVEQFTLRATVLRAFDGTLHTVPNGNIQIVSNKSRGWARAIVDVRFGYGEDVDAVRELLEELFDEVRVDEAFKDWIMEGPSLLGMERLGDWALVMRVVAETRPSKRFDVERRLRELIAGRLAEKGIRTPVPPLGAQASTPTPMPPG
ncbi:MAG: mechanosensitive ion channel family protein [Actinomycetota bacterium]